MATDSQSVSESEDPMQTTLDWRAGAIAGFVAAIVMGVVVTVVDTGLLSEEIAGLYGLGGSVVAGWIAHLVHGTLFGLVFAAVLSDPILDGLSAVRWKMVVAGVVYGVLLAVFGAGILMPIWLGAVGGAGESPTPNVTLSILAWHVVYGVVLGVLYPTVERW